MNNFREVSIEKISEGGDCGDGSANMSNSMNSLQILSFVPH